MVVLKKASQWIKNDLVGVASPETVLGAQVDGAIEASRSIAVSEPDIDSMIVDSVSPGSKVVEPGETDLEFSSTPKVRARRFGRSRVTFSKEGRRSATLNSPRSSTTPFSVQSSEVKIADSRNHGVSESRDAHTVSLTPSSSSHLPQSSRPDSEPDIGSMIDAYYVAMDDASDPEDKDNEARLVAHLLMREDFTLQDLLRCGEEFAAATGAPWRGSTWGAFQIRCFVWDRLIYACNLPGVDYSPLRMEAMRRQVISAFVHHLTLDRSAMDTIERIVADPDNWEC
jgi:hypothetical protein